MKKQTKKSKGCPCGCNKFFAKEHKKQLGLYCSECGAWVKWANNEERRLNQFTDMREGKY